MQVACSTRNHRYIPHKNVSDRALSRNDQRAQKVMLRGPKLCAPAIRAVKVARGPRPKTVLDRLIIDAPHARVKGPRLKGRYSPPRLRPLRAQPAAAHRAAAAGQARARADARQRAAQCGLAAGPAKPSPACPARAHALSAAR